MLKTYAPLLILGFTTLTGCVAQPVHQNSSPSLTPAQLTQSLTEAEIRLSQKIEQQCSGWQKQQQTQLQHLSELQLSQQQLDAKLDDINRKFSALPKQPAAKPVTAAATVQCLASSTNPIGNKVIVGQIEWLWIEAVNQVYEARVDTGATTSSLSAQDITPFEKDGKSWVRFRVAPDDSGNIFEIEAPLVRQAQIRQASSEEINKRPVVALTVRLGDMTETAEFTLTDRSQMNYPILMGREFLKDIAVVDVARSHVQQKPDVIAVSATSQSPQPKNSK